LTIRVGAVTPHLPTRRIAAPAHAAIRRKREIVRSPRCAAGLARMLRRAAHPPRRVNAVEAAKGTDAMPLPTSQPFATRRPTGPRCRGGVSSLLRLAQPAAGGLGPWIVRAAGSAALVARGDALDPLQAGVRAPSIITRLLPSDAADAPGPKHSRAGHEPAPYRFPDR
jgi:hypothetical protein